MNLKKTITLFWSVFDPKKLKLEEEELLSKQAEEGFFADVQLSKVVGQKLRVVTDKLAKLKKLGNEINDLEALIELTEESNDGSLDAELQNTLQHVEKKVEETRLETLLRGKYSFNNAILTLHSGAGGTESQDWTSMLYRMYCMYAENNDFTVKVLDILEGEEAGLKSITFMLIGDNAYGYLKCEKGVHRLVRISPFDASARRHTSFASLEVVPEILDTAEIEIRPEDLKVDTYRSSGAGGQHVNKTESAIRLTHIPTGIVVSCQTERSQIQNRETAMGMLASKLAELKEEQEMKELSSLRGEIKKIEWGSQIRSYVFHPYTLVKDHRTNFENTDIESVMNGDIQPFINEFLKKQ
ncbi:MAG: peptide chain release factor 2 [Clostridia bacterium]